jgi:thioredoxin reductase
MSCVLGGGSQWLGVSEGTEEGDTVVGNGVVRGRVYDVVVVGGGPAGLSAATWLARYRRSVLVIDSREYRNRWVRQSHGYLGSDPADPMALLARARAQVSRYPTVVFGDGEVTRVRRDSQGRFVVGVGNQEFVALRMVLATGVVDQFPDVVGFFDHYGVCVFHCPTCDGYEARGRTVVVLGWSESVTGFALELLDWAGRLTILTQGRCFEGEERDRQVLADHGVKLIEDDAVELVGQPGRLQTVRLRSGASIEADLVFFSIAHHARVHLAKQLGCELTDEGCLLVNSEGQTTIEGLYAAGDITPGIQLVSVAVGKGAIAGVACATSLHGQWGAPGSPTPAPDHEAELRA